MQQDFKTKPRRNNQYCNDKQMTDWCHQNILHSKSSN